MYRTLVAAGLVLTLSFVGEARQEPLTVEAGQSSAFKMLRTINTAELRFAAHNQGNFATLDEMSQPQVGLLHPTMKGVVQGYLVQVMVTADRKSYIAVATPTEINGALIFTTSSSDGVIRFGSGQFVGQRVP